MLHQIFTYEVHEYADGGDLETLRGRRGNLTIDEMLFYAAETIIGLEFLASRKICHRFELEILRQLY